MEQITLQTKIGTILNEHPYTAKIFRQFGLDCLGCGGAAAETLEMGAIAHGLDPEKILSALNAAIK